MTTALRPKAVREGYAPAPFVFEQVSETGETRFVAWTGDIDQFKKLVYAVLSRLPREVEVLFKTETNAASERDGWVRFCGIVALDELVAAIQAAEELVFHDGGSMLCAKDLETDEYIALDEHGTLFIYSDDRAYLGLCEQVGLENRENELINAQGHWQVRPKHHEEQGKQFVQWLNLKYVP